MREEEFARLAAAHQSELRAHYYRMLGSVHDADDALQEALVRAWKGIDRFEGRGSVRSWLEPYPDHWLNQGTQPSPEARYEQRESIELAFVAAVQYLPPLQRAVLLLREVAGFSAAEIASQLGTSVSSVTSALQRARVTAQTRLPAASQQAALRKLGDQRTRDLATRYADAMERGDIEALANMLTRDVTWSMPPVPTWFRGLEPVRDFLARYPLTDRWKHRPARASGQLAVAGYLYDKDNGDYIPGAIDVLTLEGDKITAVTGFLTADLLAPEKAGGWISGGTCSASSASPPTRHNAEPRPPLEIFAPTGQRAIMRFRARRAASGPVAVRPARRGQVRGRLGAIRGTRAVRHADGLHRHRPAGHVRPVPGRSAPLPAEGTQPLRDGRELPHGRL
jgi:RNA polymerase sigma-70 factor (ECF subfamily)